MVLVSYWFTRAHRGKAAGIIASGSGLAIILAGAVVPALLATGADGWRLGWLALAAGVLIVTVICGFLLRNKPEDLGLTPVGHTHLAETSAEASAEPTTPARTSTRLLLLHLGVIYGLFGASYAIYVTFFVTSLVEEQGFTDASAGGLWASLGFLSLFSGPLFGTLSDRIGRRAGLMIVFAIQGSAYLLAAAPLVPAFLYISAGLFGIAAWSIPSIMAAVVGDYFGAQRAASTFGTITLFFGFGQIVGPGVAGWAAEVMDGFSISFAMATALAYLAVILAALMPRPAKPK
jgi:MFS family permease